jgi:hypothetical protein
MAKLKTRKGLAVISVMAVVLGIGLFNAFSAQAVTSGTTIRGAIGGDFDVELPAGSVNGTDWGVDETLRPPASSQLHDSDVTVAGGADSAENTCAGSAVHPSAPPGTVCIYPLQSDNAQNLTGYSIAPGTGGSRFGFKLLWDASANNGDTFVDATWAYKFP